MNTNRRKTLFASAIVALLAFASAKSANALGVPGFAGTAVSASDQHCFSHSGASIVNNGCASANINVAPIYEVALPVNAGQKQFLVYATDNGNGVLCVVWTATDDGVVKNMSPIFTFTSSMTHTIFDTSVGFTPNTNGVVNDGTAFLSCRVGLNSTVDTINYNQ